jgi:hypothetical protein
MELLCSESVELFGRLYASVARDLGVNASYVKRIGRGKRESIVVEKALYREFEKIVRPINKNSIPPRKYQRRRCPGMVRNDHLKRRQDEIKGQTRGRTQQPQTWGIEGIPKCPCCGSHRSNPKTKRCSCGYRRRP